MMEALTREAQIQAITQRIASLEITTRKVVKQIDAICMQMAKQGVGIGGGHTAKDNPTKFITLAEQIELYLNSKLTPEQLAIIRTTKRKEIINGDAEYIIINYDGVEIVREEILSFYMH